MNTLEPSFIAQNQESLRQAEALWKDLQPQRALTLVKLVHTSVEESSLSSAHRNRLLAKVYYLKALAEADLDISDDANSLFIQAYNLHKEKKEYRERAAAAYFYKDNRQKAYELTEELLSEDEENPRAWMIMNQLKPALPVPDSVQASYVFKVGQIAHLAKANEGVRARELAIIFAKELQDQPMVSFLDRSNLYYWDYVAQTAMHYRFEQGGRWISLEKPQEYINDPLLKYASDLFEWICSRVHGTDFQEREMFRVARFDYCVCQYFLTDDATEEKGLVEELYRLFIGEQNAMSPTFLKGRLPVVESMPKRLLEVLVFWLMVCDGYLCKVAYDPYEKIPRHPRPNRTRTTPGYHREA